MFKLFQRSADDYKKIAKQYYAEILVLLAAFSVFFTYAFQFILGTDESDNFLAAKLLLSGHIPYVDFFSHHMPGGPVLALPLYVLSAGNALLFRLLFCATMFAWLVYNTVLLRKLTNQTATISYVLLASLVYGLSLQYQFLAESIIAYACTTLIILLLFMPPQRLMSTRWLILLSILLFSISFLALSYVYIALLLYALTCVKLDFFRSNIRQAIPIMLLPYVIFAGSLFVTGSFHDFLFQNLTFNTQYYALFSHDSGAGPLTTALAIVMTSLGQLRTLFLHPTSHLISLSLLLCFMALPILYGVVGWQQKSKRHFVIVAILLAMLFFANSRVRLYGAPAIEQYDAITHHAGLYRTLAILFFSLGLYYLPSLLKNCARPYRAASLYLIAVVFSLAAGGLLWANRLTHITTLAQSLADYRNNMPPPPIRAINAVASTSDFAWSGPSNMLNQSYLKAKIATNFTYYLPWHQVCNTCHDSFYQQLEQQKPIAIEWQPFDGVPTYPTPSYSTDMNAFLSKYYFQVRPDDPVFKNIHFLKARHDEIITKLRAAGYAIH